MTQKWEQYPNTHEQILTKLPIAQSSQKSIFSSALSYANQLSGLFNRKIAGALTFFGIMNLAEAENITFFFSVANSFYEIIAAEDHDNFEIIRDQLVIGACDVNLTGVYGYHVFNGTRDYHNFTDPLQTLPVSKSIWVGFFSSFYRAVNSTTIRVAEDCIQDLLAFYFDKFEKHERDQSNKSAEVVGIVLGSLAGAALLGVGVYSVATRLRCRQINNTADLENNPPASEEIVQLETKPLLSSNSLFPQYGTADSALTKRWKRVEKFYRALDESLPEIPAQFLDPISQELIMDPVKIDDGYTYDRASIEAWKKSKVQATCPQNPSMKISSMIRDLNLRSDIEAFIKTQENKVEGIKLTLKNSRAFK